ncbi:MAG: metallophosphoesterase [Elusimicrobiota bacterium]
MAKKKYYYHKNEEGELQCPDCGNQPSSKRSYRDHCKRTGHSMWEDYKDNEVAKKQEIKTAEENKKDAKIRRLKRIIRDQSKQNEIIDRIVSVVSDSIIEMPNIEVPELPDFTADNDETVLFLISDVHVGKKTKSYNSKVFNVRLDNLRNSAMSIVSDRRTSRPLKKVIVCFNGDIVDNESIYPGQAVDGIDVNIVHQIFSKALPKFAEFLNMLLKNFEEVEIKCTPGNHGRINQAKWVSAKSSNWDIVFYKALEAMFTEQERISFDIAVEDWKILFEEKGHGFLVTHGDMIRVYYNLPFYGATRQAQRWQAAYREQIKLSYFLFGHFHSPGYMTFNQSQIIFNGSFVTDDSFAERNIGVAADPKQMIMGIHPKHGVTWRYALNLL